MQGRCQLCSRRKALRANGTIVAHYTGGGPCEGAGFAPLEETDARLVQLLEKTEREIAEIGAEIRELVDRRANWIDPRLADRRGALLSRAAWLRRRLHRLHSWPARFVREMERQGWGYPPPAWLIARQQAPQ